MVAFASHARPFTLLVPLPRPIFLSPPRPVVAMAVVVVVVVVLLAGGPESPVRVCITCTPSPLRTEDAFRHSCESNNPPQSRPYVAGISDDIASSLRGIIRSILIREDYRCRIFAPPKARFTSRVDRTAGANVYCLFIAATRVERTTLFFLFFLFYLRREISSLDTRILVFSEK